MFFAKFNKSCLITYLGVIFGVLAIYTSLQNMACNVNKTLSYPLIFLILSGICDMFDGKFARACKRTDEEKAFGIQLDSLADTFCFLAVPIVFMLSLDMTEWYYVIVYVLFVLCGVSRLGYFNINADLDVATKVYQGLPVTSTAIIYPVLGLLSIIVSTDMLRIVYLIVTILTTILMVVKIRIPKFTNVWYIIMPILAAILIVLLMVIQ